MDPFRAERVEPAAMRRRVFLLLAEGVDEREIGLWRPSPLEIRIGVK